GGVSADLLTWNSFQVYDDAFLTRGTHSLKFGFAMEHMQNNEFSGGIAPNGQYNFGGLQAFLTNQPTAINLDVASTTRPVYVRQTLFGAYVQDDWRARPNLTLNFGLRYEPVTLPTEAHNTFAVMTSLTSAAETPVNTFWAKNQSLHNFEPRVGFAWDPFRNGKTAVRGGFGMFDVLPMLYTTVTMNGRGAPFFELASPAPGSKLPQGSFPDGALPFIQTSAQISGKTAPLEY